MKLDNKGMTLIEILISIVLISMVLLFLMNLLNEAKNETDNNNFAFDNELTRAEVLYTIENDLNKHELVGIKDKSTTSNLNIEFTYKNQDSLEIVNLQSEKKLNNGEEEYYLTYTTFAGEKHKWLMQGAIIDNCVLFKNKIDLDAQKYYLKIDIYLYNKKSNSQNNHDNNNSLDDLSIITLGNIDTLDLNDSSYLTSQDINDYIGSCTY